MSTHTGAVTVLRFSPCGRYLASGSDDRVVLIWERDESRIPRQEFGTQGEANLESWVARKRLIGHENDVQDLAWAPDSSILVTVGLDSSIMIWSGTTFEKLKAFDAHQSLIKGVTFDPANKYFATASDDRTVRIIRYHHTSATDITFSIESTISAPFKESPLSTYYRRCSWSPDGNHIAAANATNGPVTTVSIINRGTWDSEISLIGHDAPCEVAAFCPRIFRLSNALSGSEESSPSGDLITVLATAGQDKNLAVWSTGHPSPLVVALNIAEKAVTDIAWSPDGSKLFACSLDGTILVAMFEDGELGWVVPMEEHENQLTRYGGGKETMQIPSSTGQLVLEEKSETMEDVQRVERMDAIMGSNATTSTGFNAQVKPKELSTKIAKTENLISTPRANTAKPLAQKVTITKDGKKRVAPMLLSTVASEPASLPTSTTQTKFNDKEFESVGISQSSVNLPPGGVASMIVRTRRVRILDGPEDKSSDSSERRFRYDNKSYYLRPSMFPFQSDLSPVQLSIPKIRVHFKKGGLNGSDNAILEIKNGANRDLEPTKVIASSNGSVIFMDFLSKHGHLAAGDGEHFWAVATEDGTIYTYSPNGKRLIPGITLGSPISYLETQGFYLLAITSTGMVYVWNIYNSTAVHEPISVAPLLDSSMSSRENNTTKGPSITLCGVTSKGKAVITLNNGDGFIYSDAMRSWSRISEPWWAYGSHYWDSSYSDKFRADILTNTEDERVVPTLPISSNPGIIAMIENRTNEETMIRAGGRGRYLQEMARNRMLKEGYESFERNVSTAHLENRVSAAIMSDSSEEMLCFLKMYAIRLASQRMEARLEELFGELLGPNAEMNGTRDTKNRKGWSRYLCGLDKHEILKQVLTEIDDHKEVQNVSARFASSVSALDRVKVM